MGLEDRIEDEMVADSDDLLEAEFDRAAKLSRILQDGTVQLNSGYRELPGPEKILAYLIGRRYADEASRASSSTFPYRFFYDKLSRGESTIRNDMRDLQDDNLVIKDEENGEWTLVVENLDRALDRIEAARS